MQHFVIVHEWTSEYENGVEILGVTHSMDEAKEIFNAKLAEEQQYASEHGYTVYDACETDFDAGEDGYYSQNHTNLYIQEV